MWRGLSIRLMCLGLICGGMAAASWGAEDSVQPEPTESKLFPEAYGILSNDRLMYPVDVSNWPLKVDARRQLFVDDYLIASAEGLHREWHQPAKLPENPILEGELPYEGTWFVPLVTERDEDTGKFRLWYTVKLHYEGPGGIQMRFPTLYAESDDGIAWRRPKLGILEYEGSTENNFVIHGGRIMGLFKDPAAVRPEERYTALVLLEPEYVEREGYYLYTSPDGLHWTGDRSRCLIPSLQEYAIPQDGIADTSIFRYDPVLGLYVGDVKFVLPGKMRCRGQCESKDLVHWTRPRFTLYPDDLDEPDSQVYGNISFVYESMWLGMCRIYHDQRTGYKQVEVEMSMSRDGYHWARPRDRHPFIPFGGPDSWEPDYTDPVHNGPLLVNDELWFYYRGTRSSKRENINNPKDYDMRMGLAKLRRDGFASLNAGETPGTVVTRPLTFSGRSLFLNAEAGADGYVKAAVLSRDGENLESFGLDSSVPLVEDSTADQMRWRAVQELPLLEDGHVRLAFQLKNAKLYSFWIQ